MRELYPADKEMLFGLGDAEFHSAMYDSAVVYLKAALVIDPGMDRALEHLTWTYMRLERYDDAQKAAERWVQAAPSSEAYEYLAAAHLHRGDPDGAIADHRGGAQALPGGPASPGALGDDPLCHRASVRGARPVARGGQADGESQRYQCPVRSVVGAFVVLYPYLGRYREAMAVIDQGHAAAVGSLEDSTSAVAFAIARAGLLYWAYQDPRRSLAELQTFSDASPKLKHGEYWRQVAIYTALTGDTATVNAVMAKHGSEVPEARRTVVRVIESAATGQCEQALALARTLSRQSGYLTVMDLNTSYVIGSCRLASHDYDGAVASLRTIVDGPTLNPEIAPMYAMAWLRLGQAYEGKGETSDAVACYRRVLEMLKDGDPDLISRREARMRLDRLTATRTM